MTSEKTNRLQPADVARRAGIHKLTLLRWEREGKIKGTRRDHRGWRYYTEEDAQRVIRLAETGVYDGYEVNETDVVDHSVLAALDKLSNLDWGFVDAHTGYMTHSMHPYPAKFIPQIPNALIQELSSVEETVADIFCGSGTTLVEALLLKRHTVGVDASPLACHISKAKTTRLIDGDIEALSELVQRASQFGKAVATLPQPNLFSDTYYKSRSPRPDHPLIYNWFEPFVVEELAELLSWCRELVSASARIVAEIAFSSIVVAVSRQESDTRYARVDKKITYGEAFRRFARVLADAIHEAEKFTEEVEPRFTCTVLQSNVLDTPDIGMVDLVVCSPPYPNAYSYHLYHASRMVWLGMNQPKFKLEEIGSHRKYSNKGTNAATIETFRQEMSTVFSWLQRHLYRGKYACFVVGNSTIKGQVHDNADVLVTAAQPHNFVEIARIPRRMLESKKAFNPVIGKIKEEKIVILKHVGSGL